MKTLKFPAPYEKKLPHEIKVIWPTIETSSSEVRDRIEGSLVGLAVGDALGASVEFRPQEYLAAHPVRDMMSGGTWGLRAGQWTDDTSMALCLASSLISQRDFNPYDQMVRYKWWYKHGYLSSTGQCFDIGNATRSSLQEFYRRQNVLKNSYKLHTDFEVDQLTIEFLRENQFNVNCSHEGVAGNGALMRLAPVPLFFYRSPSLAVELSGRSARLTHGDDTAVDACRYYGALIVAALKGEFKDDLLSERFYENHQDWFDSNPLQDSIIHIAKGSFKRPGGYKGGIRGKGHIVCALEAALWAFWSADSFEKGALNAVNLGDDTDTTAAIYGQLAGAHYTYQSIPARWIRQLYADDLIRCMAQWIHVLGYQETKPPDQQRPSRNTNQSAIVVQPSNSMNTAQSRPSIAAADKKPEENRRKKRAVFFSYIDNE
jgi:ADP-ribosyl-[dinitrogen reductase] hydrolase